MLPGFGVLIEKEMLEARRSKRMIIFLLVMTVCLVLIPTVGYLRIAHAGDTARHDIGADGMDTLVGSWAALIALLGSLMVIASTVDAMTRERSLGIAAWILTKPVSRPSYLLAKAGAHAAIAIAMLVVVPTAVWLTMMLVLFSGVPVANVIIASAILCVEMVFLSFVTIALGVPFRSVAPITVIALALWFLPSLAPGIRTLEWTYRILPSYLPLAALSAALDEMQSATLTVPLVAAGVTVAVFVIAILQFERQEL
jgi:ABC-type transport system involved in multi-copper enzyme maturation permease subunit